MKDNKEANQASKKKLRQPKEKVNYADESDGESEWKPSKQVEQDARQVVKESSKSG